MQYDLIVIGSGPGGNRAAVLAASHGLKVAIIEKAEWGGCGGNRGYLPKHDWHHTAKLLLAAKGFARRGIHGSVSGDLAGAWEHARKLARSVRDTQIAQMKRLGINGFAATASFVDPHTIALDGRDRLSARQFVVATGSAPYVPKPFFITAQRVLTTDELFSQPPPAGKRVTIVGSGAVATEFAFILTMLGREVTWVAHNPPLSHSRFSAAALQRLNERLRRHGIEARVGARPEAVEMPPEGVRVILAGGDSVLADWVLLGTGRRPHTSGLALEAAGVNTDSKGFIKTNEYMQTSQPHIYAVGDVTNPRMSASQALADAAVAVANILAPGSRRQDRRAVPEVIHSALELGRIGAAAAEEEGLLVGSADFSHNVRALSQDEADGCVRLVADGKTGALLGAEVVGSDAAELIHLFAQRLNQPEALRVLANGFYGHPARAEAVCQAAQGIVARLPAPEKPGE
ncbi:dihydrolipoyl dehydrogenase family protein [Thiobacter aerophilum]|uniref:Dihydrolipoyl dehydrogenase n=1 Tax=Thiobacter aerophilum TaxID=3121275 RepID=A0ABV0EFV6_9BURK